MASTFQTIFNAAIALLPLTKTAAPTYCVPGDPCFPSTSVLSDFNSSIGGRLLNPAPYASVCYASAWDPSACAEVVQRKAELFFRAKIPQALMYTNWELDEYGRGCPVPDTVPTEPLNATCTLGALAPYVINATSTDDIVKSVKFAAAHKLRLRVKNSGHDYTGRSSAPGSFTIWTLHLNSVEYVKDFKPAGCSITTPVLAAGPAVDVQELFQAGADYNVTTIGGFTPSVGATGGYIIGGGTGPLGPKYGLGVDNIVQFDVVLANGIQTSASACYNPDLFWAMRGGGGVFAIHTKVYIKAHPAFQAVNTVAGLFIAKDNSSYATLIRKLVDLMPAAHSNGLYGIWETSYPAVAYLNLQAFGPNETVVAPEDMFKLFDEVRSLPGVNNSLAVAQFPTWNDAYVNVVIPMVAHGGAVGVNCADISRIVSNDLISTQAGRDNISDFAINLPDGDPFIFQIVAGGAVNIPGPTDTSVNPIWRTAFAFIDVPTFGQSSGLVTEDQNSTVFRVRDQADAVFGTDSYYNEEYPNHSNWQESMFASNYERLLAIKNEVDPNNVFTCRHCVGSESGY